MGQTEFLGMFVIACGSLIAIITPIVKLNSSIVKLNTTLDHIIKEDKTRDERISNHGKEIDNLNRTVDRHEVRINTLESEGRH